jgi:hypothetical protein
MYVFCVGKVSKYEVCRSCGGKLPPSVISRSSRDGYVHRERMVGRTETLWDKRRCLGLGEQRY